MPGQALFSSITMRIGTFRNTIRFDCGKPGSIIAAAVLVALATGCSKPARQPADLVIVTSFYPMYIATINVADSVPGVRVVNLTRPFTGCLHDYQMTPDDMKTLATATAFVVNGAGMESFLDKVVRQLPSLKLIDASRDLALISGPGGPNPHVWVSISNAIAQARNIAGGLAAWDSSHALLYRMNADRYCGRLDSLRSRMHAALDPLKSRDIITFHEAFPYFAREFHLNVVAVIEREPGSEPSAAELASTITLIKRQKAVALFAEPQYPSGSAQTIARETGVAIRTLDPGVTGPLEKSAYLQAMEADLTVLQEALGK
jgi:zinc transport system substrate-binding protein